MKAEATLTAVSLLVFIAFVFTRNAYLMGAAVFVATPLLLISCGLYLRRVLYDLKDRDLL